MIPMGTEGVNASDGSTPAAGMPSYDGKAEHEESRTNLSPRVTASLMDLEAWAEILATYGRTMRVAVALTDPQGHLLGECHNKQPLWSLVRETKSPWGAGCPFCISTYPPCASVKEALQSGKTVMARDMAGLTHVAVPLVLGGQQLGAIIAGQVFDRYPEPLLVRHVAKAFGVSAQQLWDVARKQRPVSSSVLQASGDLLCALGHAFLEQRYGKILETKLSASNGRFRLLVEGVKDHALFTIDSTGYVNSWNYGAERLLDYVEAEIMGRHFCCMFTADSMLNLVPEKHLQRALQAGRAEYEGWCVTGTQKQFWANVSITPLLEDPRSGRGFAIIIQDVTERRKITVALEAARQERTRLQENFLSHVSHELRTPLTAIYFFTTNVLDGLLGDLTPPQREHLTFALDNVKQLRNMASDLLDISRVATHKLTLEPQLVSPVKLVADVLSTCRTNAAARNISVRSVAAPSLPFVWADPARVRQILINLIDNGIKFTPNSGVITVEARLLAGDGGFVCVSLSDTGCGISPENCEIVFDRLAQVKSVAETSRSGLGLGLFISRELVSRHGGRIWVESQLGHGSTFYFTIPVFSLAKLCAPVFAAPTFKEGLVSLIAVDMVTIAGTDREGILLEIHRVLERCIHAGQDVVLPPMTDVGPVETFFVLASADASGSAVIARRIRRELKSFDSAAKLNLEVSSTTIPVAPGHSREDQIKEVTARVEQLIQSHFSAKKRLK